MILTAQQDLALKRVLAWYEDGGGRPFELHGLAGTGKTTLARYFAEGLDGADVRFAAYTGKAASRLRAMGCPGASTIHQLIYKPKGDSKSKELAALEGLLRDELAKPEAQQDRGKLTIWRRDLKKMREGNNALFSVKEAKEAEITGADLVVIDERSMLGEREQRDLESFGIPVLYLGDPGQLPPVHGRSLAPTRPDFLLTEIHRQAAESPILRLAYDVRNGRGLRLANLSEHVRVVEKSQWDWEFVKTAGQIIVGKNVTRANVNKGMRKVLGFDTLYPSKGEKLICLKNDNFAGLLNGVTTFTREAAAKHGPSVDLELLWDDKPLFVEADPGPFEETYGPRKSFPPSSMQLQSFDYGYAITGHKSQGSQWNSVVVCDDGIQASNEEFRRKWLYTVITRAEERLTVYRAA